jgi:large conductance mechanosensitive channel
MLKGFKEFITRGNVIDLAIAFVVGLAFTKVVNSLVDGVITPLIAAVFGKPDLSAVASFTINNAHFSFGLVLNAIFNLLTVAAAVYFLMVVPMNALAARRARGKAAVDEPSGPTEIELLTEIRDALKR